MSTGVVDRRDNRYACREISERERESFNLGLDRNIES